MEFLFSLDLICEKLNFLDSCQHSLTALHGLWRTSYASLNIFRVKLCNTYTNPIPLFGNLYRFSKHLHRFDLFLNSKIWNLKGLSHFHLARENCTRHDRALAFDLKTVVDREFEMLLVSVSVWYFNVH